MNKKWAEIQGWIRCECGRWADSDGRGQCQICGERADASVKLSYQFTSLLFAPVVAILRAFDPEIEI